MKYPIIPFEQPIGNFILSVMPAEEIIRISYAHPRKYDVDRQVSSGGIQRHVSAERVIEIADYSESVDAAFPTPILLSIDSNYCKFADNSIEIVESSIADIVDGQHRVEGLKKSSRKSEFMIPVVFILDGTEEQKALIFATINGKQTKVPASIIYDLFAITTSRSPQKSAHEIARALNSIGDSAWYRRLKMLGKKTSGSEESLSQGTFIKFLLPLISDKPNMDMDYIKKGEPPIVRERCIFNEYWRQDQDSIILKILLNLFNSVRETWATEWDNPNQFILTKTTGYTGIMRALPEVYKKGKEKNDLSSTFFKALFNLVKIKLIQDGMELTSTHFNPSSVGENKLAMIIKGELNWFDTVREVGNK
jgi:DGQHR domain-containing protein